jgi:hypothetical protein
MPHCRCSNRLRIQALSALRKLAMVCGKAMIELAKMTGMTPDVLTRRGRWVVCPP